MDTLILGPQILREGAKANETIVLAVEQPMANPELAAKGCSKWQLLVDFRRAGPRQRKVNGADRGSRLVSDCFYRLADGGARDRKRLG